MIFMMCMICMLRFAVCPDVLILIVNTCSPISAYTVDVEGAGRLCQYDSRGVIVTVTRQSAGRRRLAPSVSATHGRLFWLVEFFSFFLQCGKEGRRAFGVVFVVG